MKKLMVATGCAVMVAIAGCSDTQKSAESIGIIGGDDGPTATWVTTQLPWSRFCNRDFLDCVIPAFSITPGMTMEHVAAKLEQTLNTHVANVNSPVKVDYITAINCLLPLQQQTWTNVTVRTLLTDIAKADRLRMEHVAAKLEQTLNTHVANVNSPVKVDYITAINCLLPLQQQTWTNVTVRTLLTDIAKADRLRPDCLWDSVHGIVSFLVPTELSEAEWRKLIRGRGETVYAPQETRCAD